MIPVGLGKEADLNELQKTTPWKDDVLAAEKNEDPFKIAEKILKTGLTGKSVEKTELLSHIKKGRKLPVCHSRVLKKQRRISY